MARDSAKNRVYMREYQRRRRRDPNYRQRQNDISKRWKKNNTHITYATRRDYHLRHKYGITHADYEALLFIQGGKCACCPATTSTGKRGLLHVDHCHKTGRVRGLLCDNCNVALGNADDSKARLYALISYLERY